MAKILIRNGTISSSADYTLNRDTTQYIKLENGLIIFTQDVLFANDITSSANISSSGYISASHLIGNGSGIYNLNPSNINMENLVNGNGIVDFTYNGQSAATVAVDPSIAGNKLT
jgi:hypothetical protein